MISWFSPQFFSNLGQRVEAQSGRPGLPFHNVGNGHYNVVNVHWTVDPVQHERQLYQDQTGGDSVDNGFACDHSFPVRLHHD